MGRNIFLLKILLFLLFFNKIYFGSATECIEGIHLKQIFESCSCTKIGVPEHIGLNCEGQRWITIPNIDKALSDNGKHLKISSINMRDGFLMYISQDAFRNTSAQSIDLSNNYIENVNVNAFRGLEKSLYQLILTGNSLSSIPHHSLTYLNQLRYLYLQQNQISEISPQTFNGIQLKNLKYFHLDKNKISVFEKGSLTNVPLQVLTASNNKIIGIEKQSLPTTLWFLDLKQNLLQQIPYLSLRELKQLQTLDLESNNITVINAHEEVKFEKEMTLLLSSNKISELLKGAFDSFTKFGKLDLSYNQITNIDEQAFQSISSINELDLSYNSIVHIPIKTFEYQAKSLKKLNLEENDLHTLPSALRILYALQVLNMNSNKLADIDNSAMYTFKNNLTELLLACNRLITVPQDILEGMNQLQHLDLSKNRIADIEKISFERLPNLIKLNLAGNQLKNLIDFRIFDSLKSLAYLDLSYNKISILGKTVFEKLTGLESLFLQNNILTEFPKASFSTLDKLRYLILDHNKIKTFPNFAFQWLTHLERLSVSRNKLEIIEEKTFRAGPMHLRSLNLGFNQINLLTSRAFDSLPSLEQLFLNNNQLEKLLPQTFTNLKALKTLTLSKNQISEISEYSLLNLPQLEQLTLAKNNLNNIKTGAFSGTPLLEVLDLSSNKFERFTSEFLENPGKLQILNLAHNEITRFDLSNLRSSLQQLSLSHNKLQYLSKNALMGFEALTFLDLSHNEIIEITTEAFQTTKNLNVINLSHNSLRRISKTTFAEQKRIDSLSLANNFLNDLNYGVFGKNNVVDLILKNNNFTFIPSNALTSIRQSLTLLDLSGNNIKSLTRKDLNGLQNITKLILNNNKIETIEDETFADMPLIQYLDISNNPITTWSPAAFKGISESLFSLNLAQTGLFSLPKITSKGLKHLNISHNKIYEIEKHDMIILKKVKEFDASWNNLVNIKPEILKQMVELKYLDLSGNKIHYIDAEQLQHLDQLEVLKLSHLDQLIQFPHSYGFAKLRNLKELEIYGIPSTVANYNITQILHVLPPLKTIDIEIKEEELNNQLKLADVRLLRKVTIRGKDLKKINIGAFEKLRGYRLDLTITNTQIDNIPPLLFNTITTISFLKLSLPNNKILSFNPFLNTKAPILNQHGTILDSLDLQGNPILCDCKMLWLTQWIEYSVEHSTNWHEISEVLDKTECDAMPGIQDTLLSVYGNKIPGVTSKYEPTINIDEKCGHISGSKKHTFTFVEHFILLFLFKIFTGF